MRALYVSFFPTWVALCTYPICTPHAWWMEQLEIKTEVYGVSYLLEEVSGSESNGLFSVSSQQQQQQQRRTSSDEELGGARRPPRHAARAHGAGMGTIVEKPGTRGKLKALLGLFG